MNTITKEQKEAAAQAAKALVELVFDAIKVAGPQGIPSGHLYAMLMEFGLTKTTYDLIIVTLRVRGRITESGFVLRAVAA